MGPLPFAKFRVPAAAGALVIALGYLTAATSHLAAAVTAPYGDTFTGTVGTTPANWTSTLNAGNTFSIQSVNSSNVFQNTAPAGNGSSVSLLTVTNLGSGIGFTETSNFTIGAAGSGIYYGMLALATGPAAGYLVDIQGSGAMRIFGLNHSFTTATTMFANPLALNTSYTMTLTGAYANSTLNLTFNVTDGTHTATTTGSESTTTALAGQLFGLRDNNAGMAAQTVNYSSFSLGNAVPEPSTWAEILLGVLVLGRVRLGCGRLAQVPP